MQLQARLHFLQLDGPALDSAAACLSDSTTDPSLQDQGQAAAAAAAADTSALQQCIAACAPNASYDQYTAGELLAGGPMNTNKVLTTS